jgi:hypothetical protein
MNLTVLTVFHVEEAVETADSINYATGTALKPRC